MAQKTHKDVEYAVDDAGGQERVFKSFNEAAGLAVNVALSGRPAHIDVLVFSRAGARFLYGDDGVAMYDEDPEASVFERIQIKVNSQGRVA